MLWNTANQTPDEWWDHFEEADTARAQAVVEHRYESLTWLAVIGGGLADGINPCAFATIIFFLSYLQVARRTPREILLVGAAFILAVFLAYYCAGLVLNEIIGVIEKFRSVRRFLEFVLGVIALWIAWASFRDARKARAGKLDEMTLQLPGFLKERIRGVVREKTRARNFVVAAFVAGILISFLELACTGQVYAPIIFMIRKGSTSARWLLLVYNLAFIAPLVVVFLLAYGGMRSDALVRFQRNHTAKVKFALGLLFLGLGLFLIL